MLCAAAVVAEGVAIPVATVSVILFEMDLLCFGETNELALRLDYFICDWDYDVTLLSAILLEVILLFMLLIG